MILGWLQCIYFIPALSIHPGSIVALYLTTRKCNTRSRLLQRILLPHKICQYYNSKQRPSPLAFKSLDSVCTFHHYFLRFDWLSSGQVEHVQKTKQTHFFLACTLNMKSRSHTGTALASTSMSNFLCKLPFITLRLMILLGTELGTLIISVYLFWSTTHNLLSFKAALYHESVRSLSYFCQKSFEAGCRSQGRTTRIFHCHL